MRPLVTTGAETALSPEDVLQKIDALLDQEKTVIGNGDYEALIQISNQKMALFDRLRILRMTTKEGRLVQAVLQKSAENGIMVEAALRFWLGAHRKLLGLQGQQDVPATPRRNPYTLFQDSGCQHV